MSVVDTTINRESPQPHSPQKIEIERQRGEEGEFFCHGAGYARQKSIRPELES